MSVDLKGNVWFDHEHMVGAGMLDLVIHQNISSDKNCTAKFLSENRVIAGTDNAPKSKSVLRAFIYQNELSEPIRKATKFEDGSWRQYGCFDGESKPTVKGLPNIPTNLKYYILIILIAQHSSWRVRETFIALSLLAC